MYSYMVLALNSGIITVLLQHRYYGQKSINDINNTMDTTRGHRVLLLWTDFIDEINITIDTVRMQGTVVELIKVGTIAYTNVTQYLYRLTETWLLAMITFS